MKKFCKRAYLALILIFLYLPSLFHNMLIGIGNGIFKKVIPLCV